MITSTQIKEKLPERFWSKINFGEPNECWVWRGYLDRKGYGRFKVADKVQPCAHRQMYIYLFGELNKNLHVCHNCPNGDNPSCINPNHLWAGTYLENIHDRDKKERQARQPGVLNGRAKLNDAEVLEIRRLLMNGMQGKVAASIFSISERVVSKIKNRQLWTHI